MATADEAVLIEPIRVHLEWLTSVLSNYWVRVRFSVKKQTVKIRLSWFSPVSCLFIM